jgi:hypothetical protein
MGPYRFALKRPHDADERLRADTVKWFDQKTSRSTAGCGSRSAPASSARFLDEAVAHLAADLRFAAYPFLLSLRLLCPDRLAAGRSAASCFGIALWRKAGAPPSRADRPTLR